MKIEIDQERRKYIREAILCINVGTVLGLIVYQIFLYFKIAIFGWNLGLVFAPLIAGYAETLLAKRIIGEDIGAISAYLLFAFTTFYSFILKNPTLGFNLITIGSIAVILQAAFPTVINYIIFVVGGGSILYLLGILKKITHFIYDKVRVYLFGKPPKVEVEETYHFNEFESNELINSQEFYFMTSTDAVERRIINVGQFHETVIIDKAAIRSPPDHESFEKETLYNLKKGKDECLVNLANTIKAAGGNGVMDLDIQYSLIGLGGDRYQVSAMGMGIYLSKGRQK